MQQSIQCYPFHAAMLGESVTAGLNDIVRVKVIALIPSQLQVKF